MTKSHDSKQLVFLELLQRSIDKYQPALEQDFKISLGNVRAKSLRIREFVRVCFARSDEYLLRESLKNHGRPPTSLRRLRHSFEKSVAWLPSYILFYVRFRLPALFMKWNHDPPSVNVFFSGWSEGDYQTHAPKVHQWAVHEMAHGVWECIAKDYYEDHDRRWRLWNEGFAHYLADIHFRDAYPSDATLDDDWSEFRKRGKQLVSDLVNQRGVGCLREIPKRWSEFDVRD